jgi:hypothetical protein
LVVLFWDILIVGKRDARMEFGGGAKSIILEALWEVVKN